MIYTVTLDAALDRIIDIDELIYDDVNRILEERRLVSGKAIDVARVIRGWADTAAFRDWWEVTTALRQKAG